MKAAQEMQKKEKSQFIEDQRKKLDKTINRESKIIRAIPQPLLEKKLRKEFLQVRNTIFVRQYQTLSKNKVISEWTLPKMMTKAKEFE